MECKNCDFELFDDDVEAERSLHDDNVIDIKVKCPECGAIHNGFIDFDNLIVL